MRNIVILLEIVLFAFIDENEDHGICYTIDQLIKAGELRQTEASKIHTYMRENKPLNSLLRWVWFDYYSPKAHLWWRANNKLKRIKWLEKKIKKESLRRVTK